MFLGDRVLFDQFITWKKGPFRKCGCMATERSPPRFFWFHFSKILLQFSACKFYRFPSYAKINQQKKTICFNKLLKFCNSHRIRISSPVRIINYSLVNFIFCVIRDYFYATVFCKNYDIFPIKIIASSNSGYQQRSWRLHRCWWRILETN